MPGLARICQSLCGVFFHRLEGVRIATACDGDDERLKNAGYLPRDGLLLAA